MLRWCLESTSTLSGKEIRIRSSLCAKPVKTECTGEERAKQSGALEELFLNKWS
jgi:hypothetical protein